MGTKRKLFCWLLFAAAEIIVLAVAAGYFYVLDHGPLHLALTVIFLLCHIALCALARGKWFCLLFGGYWAIALLLRIYRLLYMYGLPPVSQRSGLLRQPGDRPFFPGHRFSLCSVAVRGLVRRISDDRERRVHFHLHKKTDAPHTRAPSGCLTAWKGRMFSHLNTTGWSRSSVITTT